MANSGVTKTNDAACYTSRLFYIYASMPNLIYRLTISFSNDINGITTTVMPSGM